MHIRKRLLMATISVTLFGAICVRHQNQAGSGRETPVRGRTVDAVRDMARSLYRLGFPFDPDPMHSAIVEEGLFSRRDL